MYMIRVLKHDINLEEFFSYINKCNGSVFFITNEGTKINLKSMLSQLVFKVSYFQTGDMYNGHIYCSKDSDYKIINQFLE